VWLSAILFFPKTFFRFFYYIMSLAGAVRFVVGGMLMIECGKDFS
jgi:hypothetical protein